LPTWYEVNWIAVQVIDLNKCGLTGTFCKTIVPFTPRFFCSNSLCKHFEESLGSSIFWYCKISLEQI
jgi:hypothetical protein